MEVCHRSWGRYDFRLADDAAPTAARPRGATLDDDAAAAWARVRAAVDAWALPIVAAAERGGDDDGGEATTTEGAPRADGGAPPPPRPVLEGCDTRRGPAWWRAHGVTAVVGRAAGWRGGAHVE